MRRHGQFLPLMLAKVAEREIYPGEAFLLYSGVSRVVLPLRIISGHTTHVFLLEKTTPSTTLGPLRVVRMYAVKRPRAGNRREHNTHGMHV